MNGRVEKSRRSSRAKLSKASQERLLDAALSQGAGHAQDCREESAEGFARVAPPEPSIKRRIDTTSDIGPLPAKRARSTRTDTQRLGVEDEKAEQAIQTTLQQPTPTPPKHPDASSLEGPEVSPPALLRKRQIGSGSDSDDNEHQPKRVRLTRKNLALFNKIARKKGTNKASGSGSPESTVESSITKTTSTTTTGFAMQAYKNGILDPLSSRPPKNLEDIRKRLPGSRATASPPESVYEDYVDTVGGAVNEATMVVEMSGYMLKKYPMEGYQRAFNQAFTGFPKDVGFNNGLSAHQPDFIEGLRMQEYEPFPVDEHVSGAVLYKDNPRSLTLPHVAGEWKGPGKDMEEARLQSAYDGAALVYARDQALSLVGKPDPVGHAEITTFTTDGTNINFFAHYATPSEDGTLKYHQYPVTSTNLKNSHQEFKQGRRQLRNDQDHARKQSYALRDQLKGHWKRRSAGLHPIAEGALLPVPDGTFEETNADEDEAGYEMVEQPCEPTPPTSSKLERLSKHDKSSSSRSSSPKSLPPVTDYGGGSSAQKRKASLSEGSSHRSSRPKSKGKDHWEQDGESGRYFHEHSDGRIT